MKTLRKRLETLLVAKDVAGSKTVASAFVSAMDKAVKSGVVHRNAAARAKSRAAKVFAAKYVLGWGGVSAADRARTQR